MIRMGRKKKIPDTDAQPPNKRAGRMIRIDPEFLPALQVMRAENLTSLTDEVRKMIIAALKEQGFWPWDETKAEKFRLLIERQNEKDAKGNEGETKDD